jgi:VWFA-related protein
MRISRQIKFWMLPLFFVIFIATAKVSAQSTGQTGNPQANPGQDQSIRLKTDLIEVRAVVANKKGAAIPDLKKEDFEVYENGKPQQIGFFSMVRIPGRDEKAAASPPGAANAGAGPNRPDEQPARSVVIYVDTLHLSASSLMRLKQDLRKFIDEKLTDQDLTSILTSAGSLGVAEQFTRDKRLLRYAVSRLSVRTQPRQSLFTPYIAAQVARGDSQAMQVAISIYAMEEPIQMDPMMMRQMVEARARQILMESSYTSRSSLLTLREAVGRLADLPGQRLLILASDGFSLADQSGTMDSSGLQMVTSRAARAGVVIYSIDAKGLSPPALFDASIGSLPSDPRIMSYSSAGERDLENSLNALARDTGGQAYFNTNDTLGSMGKALDENQQYYALAYYPAGEESEKKFRKITIKIKNHPEYEVRAQRGYLPSDLAKKNAAEEKLTPQHRFVNSILSPLPLTGIRIYPTVDYVELPDDNAQATLQVHVDADGLKFTEENGKLRFNVEIVTMVYNTEGKRVDLKSESIQGNLPPERMEAVRKTGIDYRRRLQLKPGLYQIRIGVREGENEKVGTAAAWIEAPDLSKKKLTPSSLFLSDQTAFAEPPKPGDTVTKPMVQSRVVGGLRYYRPGQPIVYLMRLYNAVSNDRAETDAQLQIELWQDDQRLSLIAWQPAKERLIAKDARSLIVGGTLNASNLHPGLYELRVSVKNAKQKRPVERVVAFGVE